MLLSSYRKEVFRAKCNSSFQSVHCIAHLDEDVSEVLPYLNTTLGGFQYAKEPPSVTFKMHGKLVTVCGKEIAVNALKDADEADRILEWLRREINEAWENREDITPSFEGVSKPKVIEVLKLLPQSNCQQCGQQTCMVFAVLACDGVKGVEDCPPLTGREKEELGEYLGRFVFE